MIIVFIGSGNLATRMALEMHHAGITIGQVYSRTAEHAASLARKINCGYTDNPADIRKDADLYIFSLKDSALKEVIAQTPPNAGLWVHTAGSIPMSVFEGYADRYGVMYPLQTFSKGRDVNFNTIPFFLEVNHEEDAKKLKRIATSLTADVSFLSSEKREKLHLAAVFACNFSNHMYTLAARILGENDIPVKVLQPLIDETAAKIHDMHPILAQTGPAVRYDENVMNHQLSQLNDPDMREIYRLLSRSIHQSTTHE